MHPIPEPPGDIRAQIAATLDPAAPKRAAFLVPADAERLKTDDMRAADIIVVERTEGTLVTRFGELAEMFRYAPVDRDAFDTEMALILGYPEPKPRMLERCRERLQQVSRAVQARDQAGHVVQEAWCSPTMLLETCAAVEPHVPRGGMLAILQPLSAIGRRVALRWVEN